MQFIRRFFILFSLFILLTNFAPTTQQTTSSPHELKNGGFKEHENANPVEKHRLFDKFQSAFTSSHESNEITSINLLTGESGTPIRLEHTPKSIIVPANGQFAYIHPEGYDVIIPVSLESGESRAAIHLEGNPQHIVITTDGKTAYVVYENSKQISSVDLATGASSSLVVLSKIPFQLSLGPDNKTLYVSYQDVAEITPIEIASATLKSSISLSEAPKAMAVTSDQQMICLGGKCLNEMAFYDLETGKASGTLTINNDNENADSHTKIHMSPDENIAYLVQDSSNKIDLVNLKTQTVASPIYFHAKRKVFTVGPMVGSGSTSTSISSSAAPAVFGESITFSSTVTSLVDSGIPTGTVTFVDATLGTLGTGTLNASGVASFTTSSLPVGTYSLSANYSGDANYAASSSSPPQFSQVVNQALTSTAVVGTPNPASFGSSVTFTATVSITSPGAGTLTGSVNFFDGSTSLGSSTLTNGSATFTTSTLSTGSHSITAVYSGNTNFATSTSPVWTETINKGTTSTSVATSLTPSPFGNSVTFTATIAVTAGAGTPTGTVTFTDGSTTLGTQTLSGNTATLSISTLAVGSHSIVATYNGDTNFANSVSPTLTQVISQGTTSTTVASSANPSTYGEAVTFTSTTTVATGAGTPTGTVTFKDGATVLGTSSLNGSGVATLIVSNLSVSTHSITAVYSGDTNFSTSTSSALSQVVNKAIPTAAVTSSLSPSNFGASVTFTATISAPTTLGLPTGTVTFFNGATSLGTGTLSASGQNSATATFTTSTLNAGTDQITAQYSGDGNFAAVTSPAFAQIVNPVSTTSTSVFSNSPNPSEFGQPVVLRATVTGSTASPPFPPTGTITFYDGGTAIGTSTVSPVSGSLNTATTSLTVTNFAIGSHVITAQYSGDGNYPASPVSPSMTQVVNQTSTQTAITTSGTPSVFGQNVTFSVTVSAINPGMGGPTGTVAFYDGATFLGNSSALVPGADSSTATFTTNVLSLGSHTITGIYSGDTNFTSSSGAVTQVVDQDATNTLITGSTSSPTGFNFGDYVTFTAAVSAAAPGSGTPTGTVQFFDGTTLLGMGTLSGGVATFTTVTLYPSPPTHSIKAVYSGDKNFIASTSPVFSQVINSTLPTTTTVSSSRNSSPGGDAVTYSATVVANPGTGQGIPGIPTGTVTFTDTTSGNVLGTGTLNAEGVATITEPGSDLPFVAPAPDIHEIQATYNGETNGTTPVFNPSTSALFAQYIVPLDVTTVLTGEATSMQGSAILTATMSVVGGTPPFPTDGTVTFYQGSLNLGTVPISANGTATLMPNDLHFGSIPIVAIYSGDTTQFAMSTSNTITLQVQQTDMLLTSTTVSSSLPNSIACQPVTFTAVVTETQGFYTPTGTVTFFSDDVSIGTSILDDTGTAVLTVSTLAVGTHSVTATYNSDSNYAFSFGNTITQVVSPNTTSTVLTIIPLLPTTPYGQNLILSAIVSSTTSYTATPTGTVTFFNTATPLETQTVPLNSSGEAIYEISTLDVGAYTFTATYNPTGCFSASSGNQSHTIVRVNPTTTFTVAPSPSTFGNELTLTATVTSTGGTPTGSITFFDGSTNLGTTFIEGGVAILQIPSPPAGLAVLYGAYSGDTNYLPINTAAVQQTINKAATSTCLVSFTTNPSIYGELVSLNATVSSAASGVAPGITGTVTFTNGSTLLGVVTLSGCTTAELETSGLTLGSANNIVATYSGDSNFLTSSSAALNATVIQASTTTAVTSITSTPSPPTFGTLVTFNVAVAAVSPGSGTPTGTVTGYYGTTILGTGTLVNGVASFASSALPVGVQTIIVKYSGDTNFTASQTTATETVVTATTTSTLTSSANPSVFGQPVTFSVTVASSQGTPTGTVSFLDGTTTLGTQTLNSSGTASFTTSSLSVATHTIKAIYSGSANLASSTSSTINQVVNKDATTTTLTSSLNPAFYGEVVIWTATVAPSTPGGGVPTGTVTFKNGATTVGSGTLNSSGQATLSTSTTFAASTTPYAVTAVYSGDGNFTTSTGALSQTINKAPTMISASYSPNPAALGAPVTLNVTVAPISPGAGIPTGTVTASYGSQIVGTGTLSGTGTVTFQTTNLPAGTLGIVVQYLGDSNFLSSTIPLTETINEATSTTTLTSSVNPSLVGQPVTFSVSVTSTAGASGIPTGFITYFDGTQIIGTQALDDLGHSKLTLSNLAVGTHQITAVYNGDDTNSNSTSSVLTQVVNTGATTTTLTSIVNPSVFGESVTFNALVAATAPGAGLPTGTVTFKNGGVTIPGAVINLNGLGSASFSIASLPVGTNLITAVYSGDANFTTSTSTALSEVVAIAPTIISVTSGTNPSTFGSAVTISGTVQALNNGSTTLPSGTTITAFYGATAVGSGVLNASGQYSFSITGLPAGVLAIEVKYPGTANFSPSTITLTQTVSSDVSSITLTTAPNPSTFGQAVTLTSTVTLASGQTPTGTVTYYDGTTALGTKPVGQTLVISTLSPGTHPITAVYSGSSSAASVTSSIVNQVVNAESTSTALTSSLNPSGFGESITLHAVVSPTTAGAGLPTGTVTFKNGGVTIPGAIVTLDGYGGASFTTASLPIGTNSITAVYSGDTNFTTSTSTALSQVVGAAPTSISATSSPNPSAFGSVVTVSGAVQSVNNPSTVFPSGTITVFHGSTEVGSGTLNASGQYSIALTGSLPAGTSTLEVNYLGTADFSPSTITLTQTVNSDVSSVTLATAPNPSTFGQAVTLTSTVTLASGQTPTGTITYYDGTVALGTTPVGQPFSISTLTPGTHPLKAVYNGSASAATATSSVVNQVVNQGGTTTTLNTVLNPSVYGESVTFTALVSPNSVGAGFPTGTVTFESGGVPLPGGVATVNSLGQATVTISPLPLGTHTVTAVYSGDTNFTTSTSAATSQLIAQTPTITSVTSGTNPSVFGAAVPISGTVQALNNGSATLPSGTIVTAFYGSTAVGSGALNASGQYAFSLTGLPAGVLAIEVKYPGSADFTPSTITLTQTVGADVSNLTLASAPNPSAFGQPVTLTSSLTLASGQTPTGTVTYFDGTTALGTTPVNQALVISTLAPGTHSITAVYSGSANAASATSNVVTQVVNQSTTTTTLASSLNPSVFGNTVTFTATVAASASGVPTGFVTFLNGGTAIGTGELDSAGNAVFSTSQLPGGSNSIKAVYSGDTNFGSSTSTILTQVVNKAAAGVTSTTVLTSTPNPSIFGQPVTFFASVASSTGTPTGTVTYFDGGTAIGTVPLSDGLALLSISSLTAGNHNITAVYNGDTNFNPSAPSPIYMQIVDPVAITITTVTTLTSSNNPSNYGDPVTFNVQVTSAVVPPPYPTGFVTLYTGSVPLVTLALNATGGATYTTSALPAGDLQIVALYSGDHTFSASTDVISQVVNPIVTTTTLTSSLNPSTYGASVTFTATVASGVGNPMPTGSVSFFDGGTLLETTILTSAGVANFVTSDLTVGLHAITAVYNADTDFATSTASVAQVVDLGTTTTTILTSSPNPSALGDSVTFIASTRSNNNSSGMGLFFDVSAPTGTLTFFDGTTQLGTSPLVGGLAFFSTSALTVGSHSITAVYSGDTNYTASTSAAYIQVVINEAAIVESPRGFCAHSRKEKFLTQTDYITVLTWNAPGTGAEPEFYKIYSDAQLTNLIATIPACQGNFYEVHNRTKGKSYTYYIVAGTQAGISPAVSVTVTQ